MNTEDGNTSQEPEPPITVKTDRKTIKDISQKIGTSHIKFDNPAGKKRKTASAAFLEGRTNLHEEKRMTKRPPRSAQERTNISRADLMLEAEVQADPVETVRKRLTKMFVMETRINDELYENEVIDHAALSASNKRLVDLSQALKALPSQSAGENKGSQRSTAELIADMHAKTPEVTPETQAADAVGSEMISRADAGFGDGA